MNKNLKIIIPVAVVLLIVLWFVFKPAKKSTPTPTPTTRKTEQINQLPIEQRPYVTLVPRADGREVTMTIAKVVDADKVEYEMEYQTDTLIQGVFGTIDFATETLPVSKNLLFGSCSKGKCRYDEGVSGGSLTLRFEGENSYVLKSDFNLQLMGDKEGVFTSKDARASLDVGRAGLPNTTYLIISGTMGFPEGLTGKVLAGPYSFLAATSPKLASADLTIKSNEDLTGAKLMYFNGKTWEELSAVPATGGLSAPVTALGTYVLVK